MAVRGWGKCPRCGEPHATLIMRGLCAECQEKAGKQASIDRVATPDKLREHPDLADIEVHMEGWYG